MTKARKILKAIAGALFPFHSLKTQNKKKEIRNRITSALLLWFIVFLILYRYTSFTDVIELIKYLLG